VTQNSERELFFAGYLARHNLKSPQSLAGRFRAQFYRLFFVASASAEREMQTPFR
jgi:trans-aconitate methyltransferase